MAHTREKRSVRAWEWGGGEGERVGEREGGFESCW